MTCMLISMECFEIDIDETDVHISYLPLAHIFERMLNVALTCSGSRIGFFRGNSKKNFKDLKVLNLVEDIQILKPTLFVSVPRLFNRIYAKLVDGTINAAGVRGMLFRKAVSDKLNNLKQYNTVHHSIWDRILFSRVAAILGGRVRLMLTASAPLAGEVMNFLRVCFSCPMIEAYGATETTGLGTLTFMNDFSTGHVGVPFPCVEIKLVDVPEMNYLSSDKPCPRGEICIRGHSIFKGYFKDPKNTKESLDDEGWYLTGDIGKITQDGKLAVIDRKKNIFKLAQGEYVAPEKIENVYLNCEYLAQIFVHGDPLQAELVAIVVPEPTKLSQLANKLGLQNQNLENLCRSDVIKEKLLAEMNQVAKYQKLQGFEIVRAIYIEHSPFTVENDLLTSTMKLKRAKAKQFYKLQLDQLYDELNRSKQLSKL
ncbi:AMP-dependent synthetase/ligase domain-containing protein [Rozella allomycis CSF55]|uniref:AMP-dependent synthetase/ligase domain-containing protein n=1 Tax=Rozella allomycis (strain CSF55) TaxID=988480 RepID=A0A075AXB0_ROZAC|nr:AMP-dependent synthetase/ligase domain-containing protein [Rozella allomycis CSF55]|eukprot:EPZ34892.1 AMP-dependent synthetase/ligase domain-containing protein [Rozella allomycis CSF55]